MLSLRCLLALGPLVAVAVMTPRPAEACSPDPCQESNRWVGFDLSGTTIAPDGVLRFSAERLPGAATIEDALGYVEVTVSDELGGPIEGALEYHEDYRAYAWRPVAPLTPGSAYQVSIAVDNDALALALDEEWVAMDSFCGENLASATMIETTLDSLEALSLPEPSMTETHSSFDTIELDTLVCCDGAYPEHQDQGCGWYDVTWSEGHCAAAMAWGNLRVEAAIAPDAVAPEVLANTVVRLVQTDGAMENVGPTGSLTVSLLDSNPFCVQLEGYDLAHGTTWVGPEHCFGDALVDQLGEYEIDPTDELAACAEQSYTCETVGETWDATWDPEQCTPWGQEPPGGSSEGGVSTDGGTSPGDTGVDDGTPADGSGGDDEGTLGGDAGQDDDVSGRGCSCQQSGGAGGLGGLWLLVAGAALRGRRRRPAR